MTSGQTVEDGNSLVIPFATSNIAGGAPPGWGEYCEAYIIGPVNGGCYRYVSFDPDEASKSGYITEFDCLLADPPDSAATVNTIAFAKAHHQPDGSLGDIGNSMRCWRIFIEGGSGFWRFLWILGEDGFPQIVWPSHFSAPGIAVGTSYRLKVVYDLVSKQISGYFNGMLVGTVSEAGLQLVTGRGMTTDVAHQIVGGSSSSDGRNVVFLIDNMTWTEIPKKRGGMRRGRSRHRGRSL